MQTAARAAILTVLIAAGIFLLPLTEQPDSWKSPGGPKVVAIYELPETAAYCEPSYVPVAEDTNLFSALGSDLAHAGLQQASKTVVLDRDPIRQIRDLEPIYGSLGINNKTNEVFLGDANFWSIRVFNRTDNTPPGVPFTPPKRIIRGLNAQIQFVNGIYIDPKNGDIYAVETDTGDKIIVFNYDDQGNVKPKREIAVPHRGFSLAVDEEKQEIFVGVNYPPEVAVFRKDAFVKQPALRHLQGESTRLAYVHGMVIDPRQRLMFVANWGRISDYTTPGTGRFEDPSISVYPLDANGDTPPVKVIRGDKTQLNWPAQMAIDTETGEIFVANDMGHSVLVFKSTDEGNVAPTRVIKGDRTTLQNPLGIAVDKPNNELWVVDMGNSSASVFPLKANGNVAPLRRIRSAPEGKKSLKFGKVEAMAYDPMRDVVWVPN
jgi:6-phosphogluconolactonase (cycloisomerase 2 family)